MEVLGPRETGEFVAKRAHDVKLNPEKIKVLAEKVCSEFTKTKYRLESWKEHELHPKECNTEAIHWILVADSMNFCFWSSHKKHNYGVKFNGKLYTGYWSIHACIRRALQEGIPITNVNYFANLTKEDLRHILRSDTKEPIPLFDERFDSITEAGQVLLKKFQGSFVNCILQCENSAQKLVNLIIDNFSSYKDEADYSNQRVSFYKRAQIVVADVWACFQGEGLGLFHDIDYLTMFADYRVPQVLVYFGAMEYSPELLEILKKGEILKNGHALEVEIRACSIAAVELLKKEIQSLPKMDEFRDLICNSCILDFYLWDYRRSHAQKIESAVPHHRVRCIYY